ncbi:MAG TPA: DUF11 domain-containing protein [Thermoanaerobaculia bacterium]|nr:DUF11 domain-containing protein [Thermoanaerobaculia bacterium]
MKTVTTSSICAALAVVLALPSSAALQKAAGGTGAVSNAPNGVPVLLYDQTNNPAGNGVPDQDFEASFDAYDSEAADDFVVTDASGWTVEQVRTVGTTGTAGGSTVSVTFFANAAGGGNPDLPGAAECTYTGISPTDAAGSFMINLPTPCILGPATHWVRIQTNQNFGSFGQHFWSNRSTQTNSESVWRNPGDGFATGCTTFTPQRTCGVGGGASPDLLFSIWGQVGGLDADLALTKTGVANGNQVVYTLTATNNGPSNATGVVVTDTLPASLMYSSNDCGGTNNPPFTWNIGNLANGASVVCNVTATVGTPGAVANTATITGTSNDPTPANNTSTVTLEAGFTTLSVPTLNWVGLGVLFALLAAAGLILLQRRSS